MKTGLTLALLALTDPFWVALSFPPDLAVGLAALLLTLWLVAVMSRRLARSRDSRVAVKHLGGRGRSVGQIARELGLSQDAVRNLMQPDPAARRATRSGNSCRSGGGDASRLSRARAVRYAATSYGART